jgi:hypothetical protein
MLLANCLIIKEFGRKWRIGQTERDDVWIQYADIVMKFIDSPTAPFSIQRIALQGCQFDKKVGEWFGPVTISHVLKQYDANQEY